MDRILPGVRVSVVKEVVPPQPAPSGVLGLIGITEKTFKDGTTVRASNWNSFVEFCGPSSVFSIPEARQALQNGVFELVICPLQTGAGKKASVQIPEENKKSKIAFRLTARSAGPWANDLLTKVTSRKNAEDEEVFDLEIRHPTSMGYEVHRNLSMDKGTDDKPNPHFVESVLENESNIVTVEIISENVQPMQGEYKLEGGRDGKASDYCDALSALVDEPDVDMVLASIQDLRVNLKDQIKICQNNLEKHKSDKNYRKTIEEHIAALEEALKKPPKVYGAIISHCQKMSKESKGRVGFGEIGAWMQPGDAVRMVENLKSDRFVLLAPNGVAGAVAGMIGGLKYNHSPTFKNISGLGDFSSGLGVEDQRKLLKAKVVPVAKEKGRGLIVLQGMTTDGDQINVRRIADRAVRGVKMIGESFIGRLNTEDGRGAMKQKLIEFLVQMEKEDAIVPSPDGSDPAFKVDVYSSQTDFALGIVRVDMAVRPVRAIDYIYATVLVQV